MTTGPDSSGHRSRTTQDQSAIALEEVFNRFALDSRRHNGDTETYSLPPSDVATSRNSVRETEWPATEPPDLAAHEFSDHSDRFSTDDAATFIRPYSWTGGRTSSHYALELHTLISASRVHQESAVERWEHLAIADLCQRPRSVAEVGAVLSIPLGVAKVLVGDMAELGLIQVHDTVTEPKSTSHLELMERVLTGLQNL